MIITVLDLFYDQFMRPYSGWWLWESHRPLQVELHLTPAGGRSEVWVLARDLLTCPPIASALAFGPDVDVAAWYGFLLITLYPHGPHRLALRGSLVVVRDFLAATQCAVPRCVCPERCAGCEECDAALAEIDGELCAAAAEVCRLEQMWRLPAAAREVA